MRSINPIFVCVLYALLYSACSFGQDPPGSLFERVIEKAQALAAEPYQDAADASLPEALEDLDYQAYRDIRFRKDHALWKDAATFSAEFFHPGFLYREPVTIHEVVNGEIRTLQFDPAMFGYGRHERPREVPEDVGFAGFRLHYPLHDPEYQDELIVFLGASYFRMVGRGQNYGLSARGLAVNTALSGGEEFPRFAEFWLVRPAAQSNRLRFYALLDSPSVTGAYAFDLETGADTVLNVQSRLFARGDVEKLGVAPLTSMYAWGSHQGRSVDDYRPRVHDSDGLLQHTGAGEWIWRPLSNPPALQVSSLQDASVEGFGLAQRQRSFESFQDPEARYHNRPGIWVTPDGDWGRGAVELVEIPAPDETHDNIVAYWVGKEPFKAGQARSFDYELRTFGAFPNPDGLASVQDTRNGWGGIPGSESKPPHTVRQIIVDFAGPALKGLESGQPVQAELDVNGGEARDVSVSQIPDRELWRAAFKLHPADPEGMVDMRLFLKLRGQPVSETWSYLWNPAAVQRP